MSGRDDLRAARATANSKPPEGGGAFPLLSYGDLLALPEPTWLVAGIIPEGLAVLFGAPGTYKSFVALDWALCVATGRPWHGHAVEGGHVVYVAAEGAGGLARRVGAWAEHHGATVDDLGQIHFLAQAVNLLDGDQVERTRKTLATLPEPPALLVVDTAARSMVGGDENSARDVGSFIAAVDEQRVGTRLVVHHAGKGGDERGSSALRGAADVMARVDRKEQSPRVELHCDKPPKDGEAWATITLDARQVARSLVMSVVPTFTAAVEAEKERRKRVLQFVIDHGSVSRNQVEKAVGGKATDVRRTLDQLAMEGEVLETRKGASPTAPRTYSALRPGLWDEAGTKYPPGTPGHPGVELRPEGGDMDVVHPLRDEVDQSPRPGFVLRPSSRPEETPRQHVDGKVYEPPPDWHPDAQRNGDGGGAA